jgi:DNA-3-methyladenine glycosylase II
VIGALFREYGMLRPVCFGSPYEAAVWGILAQRIPMRMAAKIKLRIAAEHGAPVSIAGHRLHIFPEPTAMLSIESVPGLPSEKLARLKSVANAAMEGRLDPKRLRATPPDEALADLERIRGVGTWTAGHILVRGAGTTDELPLAEPRVLRAVAHAYGLARTPSVADAARIAEAWRPFRTWIAVLLVVHLSRTGVWSDSRDMRGKKATSKKPAANKRVRP